ncbi:NUMOD3 domain-containing DNA-binding protein [Candidatus Lokiarchaeum ossiferum]
MKNINKWTMQRLEGYYMVKYNTLNPAVGYNMRIGGSGGFNTEEQNEKTRQSNTGKKQSEETCRRKSKSSKGRKAWNGGKNLSQEHKDNIAASQIGRDVSDKTRKLLSELIKGENHPNWKQKLPEEHCKHISEGKLAANIRETVPQVDKQCSTKEISFFDSHHLANKNNSSVQSDIQAKKDELIDHIKAGKTYKELCDKFNISQNYIRNFMYWAEGTRNLSDIRKKYHVSKGKLDDRNKKISQSSTKDYEYLKIPENDLSTQLNQNLSHAQLKEHFHLNNYQLKKLFEKHYGKHRLVDVRELLKEKKQKSKSKRKIKRLN